MRKWFTRSRCRMNFRFWDDRFFSKLLHYSVDALLCGGTATRGLASVQLQMFVDDHHAAVQIESRAGREPRGSDCDRSISISFDKVIQDLDLHGLGDGRARQKQQLIPPLRPILHPRFWGFGRERVVHGIFYSVRIAANKMRRWDCQNASHIKEWPTNNATWIAIP